MCVRVRVPDRARIEHRISGSADRWAPSSNGGQSPRRVVLCDLSYPVALVKVIPLVQVVNLVHRSTDLRLPGGLPSRKKLAPLVGRLVVPIQVRMERARYHLISAQFEEAPLRGPWQATAALSEASEPSRQARTQCTPYERHSVLQGGDGVHGEPTRRAVTHHGTVRATS